ncbi:hypothetical protein AKJ41_02135 [candidate division MSBL1 archaeon SCGC-AAA259O05]|uniref:Uncharacterized protein n=1 Tax=candidate division MSBL1 archaeon SCGC-AAA259O05 TaxID=1698271 RepID=A0A133V4C9_9EURY|nr:hypothetical protein AKJ41_02135 [candidate division MSBL1 archaeon SCGC-AAA259O05]
MGKCRKELENLQSRGGRIISKDRRRKGHREEGIIWKKAITLAGIAVAVWLATPIPEVSIVVGLLGEKAFSGWIPWWLSWPGAAVGVLVGWHFDIPEKVHRSLKGRLQEGP